MKSIIAVMLLTILFIILGFTVDTQSREAIDKNTIDYKSSVDSLLDFCVPVHNIGKLELFVNPATGFAGNVSDEMRDCFSLSYPPESGVEFPKGTGISYLADGQYWIGGIIGNDTLVTLGLGTELQYNQKPAVFRSIIDPDAQEYLNAKSEQDYIYIARDTFPEIYINWVNPPNKYPHRPLNIEVTQSSYCWSYGYAEDFVLFNIEIKNIGDKFINDMYFGLKSESYSNYFQAPDELLGDAICGLLNKYYFSSGCGYTDSLYLSWGADNDGDPDGDEFKNDLFFVGGEPTRSTPDISGIFILDYPISKFGVKPIISYNWWHSLTLPSNLDYGPQMKNNIRINELYGTGYPYGDLSKYFTLSNGEIDFDQVFISNISSYNSNWVLPNEEIINEISKGSNHIEQLLSIGPFDIPPGGVLKIPFAYVAGEDFHTDPSNIDNLPYFPANYYQNVDFSDLAKNAQWARWIYDNPGIDTDGDGYAGEFQVCTLDSALTDTGWVATVADTFYIKGDGVPDWRAAGPPPPPKVWVEPGVNSITIRFNGTLSETEKDIFTKIADFEGYNVYFGRDEREASLSLVASYDNFNYDKYVYLDYLDETTFELQDIPFTLEELCCLYGDSCNDPSFDPLSFGRTFPYVHPEHPDSIFYFRKHSFNTSDLGANTPITKVYPDALDPRGVHPDSLTDDFYTEDSLFKFFEYEVTIDNLLPSVEYYVNVTAFDFGSPKSGLKALETSKTLNVKSSYPLTSESAPSDKRLQVFIYPNPYRIDGNYRDEGLEGRNMDSWPDFRVREIHFANLPPRCTIRIFSLDGDLVRELDHDVSPDDPNYRHHVWDMITRNTQMVVSGLYYWSVEFDDGTVQMGKLAVIM